jgi:hypothetical protein
MTRKEAIQILADYQEFDANELGLELMGQSTSAIVHIAETVKTWLEGQNK